MDTKAMANALPEIIQNYPTNLPKVPAPEEVRALVDDYQPERGWGPFNDDIANEGGPDGSEFVLGARFEGITGWASQSEDERHGYFIGKGSMPLWRWVLWLCQWDDQECCWSWCAAAATTAAHPTPAKAAEVLLRAFWTKWAADQDMSAPQELSPWSLLTSATIREIIAEVFVSEDQEEEAEEEE